MSTTLTSRQIAFRTARRERDMEIAAPIVSALFGQTEEVQYAIDAYGRKTRLTAPSDTEIAHFLRDNRVVDSIEMNEYLGVATITKLIQNGSLARSPKHNPKSICSMYWITTKAADIYGIPATWTNDLGTFKLIEPTK